MQKTIHLTTTLNDNLAGMRLDKALAMVFPEYSRSRLQQWIQHGFVLINQSQASQRYKVIGGENIKIHAELDIQDANIAEPMPLEIIHEDHDIIIINKPADLIVHPGSGNAAGTLLNGLLHHDPQLEMVPRAGIIHRLDKDTTGLMVVAKTLKSHSHLVAAMQKRQIHRDYLTLVRGTLTAGGTIKMPIGRHPHQRTKMAIKASGKQAITHYRVTEKFPDMTLVRCQLETGRTHQIRVHMQYIKHPIIGDQTYAGRSFSPKSCTEHTRICVRDFPRQALHATQLCFLHPSTEQQMKFTIPLPNDFKQLLEIIRNDGQ